MDLVRHDVRGGLLVARLGRDAVPTVSLGASDAKHWRDAGVPAYLYGCAPNNMAKPDEWVDVEDYLHIVRTHALAAAAFLSR